MDTWLGMLKICRVESLILELKQHTCNGSMLKGHTVKPDAEINSAEVHRKLLAMEEAIAQARCFFHCMPSRITGGCYYDQFDK